MAIPFDDLRWEDDDEFWRTHYNERPYFSTRGGDYDFYQPGYRYGYEAAHRYPDRDWRDLEPELSRTGTSTSTEASPRGSRSRTRRGTPGTA